MCSVVGCYSGRRNALRFKLPEDPERRLQWVQFLATVNKQRFKESSCADIAICMDHFKEDCFEKYWDVKEKFPLRLKPSAVPSVCVEAGPEERHTHLESPKRKESVELTDIASPSDHAELCHGPVSTSEESGPGAKVLQESPVPIPRVFSSTNAGQMRPKRLSINLMREKAERLQVKGTYIVNEKCLLQLFRPKCPSCGSKLEMKKVTHGLVVILIQQCLQCDYKNQWKSQVDSSVLKDEDLQLMGVTEDVSESQEVSQPDATPSGDPGVPEIVAVIDEERDPMDQSEESTDQDDVDSDEDWRPEGNSLLAKELQQKANDEEDGTEEDDGDEDRNHESAPRSHRYGLCSECGWFFIKSRPHTCEHKTKPFACNICGKRFSTEIALTRHSRIHDANYEFRCKFCHDTFKTKADKFSHEQIHMTDGKPYKCPDCTESFASNKERRIHIEEHRGPPQLKCHICGIEFCWPLALKRHLAVHTGEKPYKCSVCDRGFNQPSHLKSHMRLHTGERPFKCQYCDKCFNHNVSLKSHVQRYHPSESNLSNNATDAQGEVNMQGTDSGLDNVEEEQDTEEEGQMEGMSKPKYKKKSTGRPKGRPKSEESSAKNKKGCKRLKRKRCNDEENEDEQSNSDTFLDPADEEEMAASQGRAKKSKSDVRGRKNNGQSLKKRRGRPRKNP